jgi:hypothetical protein
MYVMRISSQFLKEELKEELKRMGRDTGKLARVRLLPP